MNEPISITRCIDCMEAMKHIPDKYFDLAVVDPPFGHVLESCSQSIHVERLGPRRMTPKLDSVDGLTATISVKRTGGTWSKRYQKNLEGIFDHDISDWGVAPTMGYFNELARVSKNQIIWDGNYFDLPPTRCFLVWRKLQIPLEGFSMSPVEYAWTSFNLNAAYFEAYSNSQAGKTSRFHPTQKPISLYSWIFRKFAKPGYKILDTHLGSGSSRIAAYQIGLDFVGFEIDDVYFKLEEERFQEYLLQMDLLRDSMGVSEWEQTEIGG